jgi:toxin HigB-1
MIKSFQDKEAHKIFCYEVSRKFSLSINKKALIKLLMLDAATEIFDLRIPPGNKLEVLRGDRKGQYSIRINKKWRICFVWRSGNVYHVEIVDYH